jgi:RNA polymerase sigma-70 factor (ECF subfamily)
MPNAQPISREIIARVHAREEEASRELVRLLQPLVLRVVRVHRPRRMSEEDLCQEVFLRVFHSLGQYRGVVPFEHWVARLAVNTCIDQLRRHRCRPELRWADLHPDEAAALAALRDGTDPGPAATVVTRDLLERMLATLSPEDQLVIRLTALEERPLREVAALTGWSRPLVKVRAFRARRRMRQALAELLAAEDS